jgi:Asp-tRNA(Asn)/Glu-tRNA(Gln) amidotransferase A subunit family amidase
MADAPPPDSALPPISPEALAAAETLIGLEFTAAERELMLNDLAEQRQAYAGLRTVALANAVSPAFRFDPGPPDPPIASAPPLPDTRHATRNTSAPADLEDVAFWPVTELAELIRSRQITSVVLTEMYLGRLKRYDPVLHCVITLTEERAREQARRADAEIAAGHYRGPLHGIPWGAKDLLATRGIRTTWGAEPYQDQVPDSDATVVARLDAAGAVLVAKLSVGALAWGDVWFGGTTRNPWRVEEGSSGSSAGSAAAVAAGLVGFALGSETLGSIVSPAMRCGVTGLRPTFGRVSRHGAMALSWTMDKIGPLTRSVADCAPILAAIAGPDGHDPTVVDAPFAWTESADPSTGSGQALRGLRIGYVAAAFEEDHEHKDLDDAVLGVLRDLGATLVPITLPDYPVSALSIILTAEAGAAFDDLTRSGQDDLLTRQGHDAWPNVFRAARMIPAVEYIQANRVRSLVMAAMRDLMATIDAYVVPSYGANNLLITNLTGHPSVVLPHGFTDLGTPHGITFVGRLFDEAGLLRVAHAYQQATDFHLRHPALENSEF